LFLAALLGKPIGVLAAVAVSLRLGLRFPDELGWRELVVVAFTASIGFTSALWLAASAVPIGPVLLDFKSGALLTLAGAIAAAGAAAALRVGRFRAASGPTGP